MTLAPDITEAGVYAEITNAEYHAHPALSASGMKAILDAPAKYAWEREHRIDKDEYDFGSAYHARALGDPQANVVVIDEDTWRSKDARGARDEARDAGSIPILRHQSDAINDMCAALFSHPRAATLLAQPGEVEHSAFWQDSETGTWLRARFDLLPHAVAGVPYVIPDLKSARDARPDRWIKTATEYGYHVQEAVYRAAVEALGIHPRPQFEFIVQEKEPPYLVSVVSLCERDRMIGEHLMRKAITTFNECTRTGTWPGYGDETHYVELPAYYTRQFEGVI